MTFREAFRVAPRALRVNRLRSGLTMLGAGVGTQIDNLAPLAPPVLSVGPVILAFAVSLAIGPFFGAYPASRAARLRPIEALRHE